MNRRVGWLALGLAGHTGAALALIGCGNGDDASVAAAVDGGSDAKPDSKTEPEGGADSTTAPEAGADSTTTPEAGADSSTVDASPGDDGSDGGDAGDGVGPG
jgi:hypothetical protein